MGRKSVPPGLRVKAQKLRKEMTRAEELLWEELRARRFFGALFRRQVPIGPYIADFACHEHRLVVEVDGDSHEAMGGAERDARRTERLQSEGYRVVRLDNDDVTQNMEGALLEIGRFVPGFQTDLDRDA